MSRLILVAALLAAGCGGTTVGRFVATGLPVGDLDLRADRCFPSSDMVDGVPMTGVEFTSESAPGWLVYVLASSTPPSASIMPESGPRGALGIIHVDAEHATPTMVIPAARCEVFRASWASTFTGWRVNHRPIYRDEVMVDVSCSTPEGGRLTGSVRWSGYCR